LGVAIVVVRAVTLRGWCHQLNFGDAFSATVICLHIAQYDM
jgi:hypothetical protein